MRKLLYHYTSSEAFVSMISHAKTNSIDELKLTFWASNVYYMNDTKEMTIICDKLKEVLPKIEKELGIDKNVFSQKDSLCYFVNGKALNKEEILTEFFFKCVCKEVYVISFSDQRDKLPMWSLYGCKGNGVCLVFDKEKLDSALDDRHKTKEVYYSLMEGPAYKYLKEKYKDSYYAEGDDNSTKKFYFWFNVMLDLLGRVKDPAYNYEKEFRIIDHVIHEADIREVAKRLDIDNAEREPKNPNISDAMVRVTNGLMVPYKEISLPIECLDSIIIGPSVNAKLQQEALRILLKGTHLNENKIFCSSVPYRNDY